MCCWVWKPPKEVHGYWQLVGFAQTSLSSVSPCTKPCSLLSSLHPSPAEDSVLCVPDGPRGTVLHFTSLGSGLNRYSWSLCLSFWLLPWFIGERTNGVAWLRSPFYSQHCIVDKFTLQIFSQCVWISNHHIVHIKTYYNFICQLTSIKLERITLQPCHSWQSFMKNTLGDFISLSKSIHASSPCSSKPNFSITLTPPAHSNVLLEYSFILV